MKVEKYTEAMRVACRLGVQETMEETFNAAEDKLVRRQMCYMLARHGHPLKLDEGPCEVTDADELEELQTIMSNSNLAELSDPRSDLDVMEAKLPEDIYKTHLMEGHAPLVPPSTLVRTWLRRLSTRLSMRLVKTSFSTSEGAEGTEVTGPPAGSNVSWIFKNKDHGKMSAAASLGSILLWDVEDGLPRVDNYLYSMEQQVVAGGLLPLASST